ncbi:hypothetical protein EPUS_07338 [Endocarpon pusillum Z07020]|uniref:Protein N-terminal and lysine N-methyltransferase EFM7 n=1 Tax=Endocarpon pusillum (strain Z07020 / HMAS-L-300199) TaxID=1263415 RepID=U1FZV2_ENDPU|nr:uncharacterized protein EPUS_07338 [Endocarpon pusillum Z07020]ERF70482.1 hypothetical protein EPUS_07338 [Endocarpon pusillum Z07020]
MSSDSDDALEASFIFKEPEDFYPPETPPSFAQHTLLSGQTITLRLVGHNPLWGHLLWNASRITADYLEEHADTLVKDKSVLEFGAGAGLPSLVCAINGAKQVVVTDYPDEDLIENLRHNIEHCTATLDNIVAEGYLWGNPPSNLTSHLPSSAGERSFDLLILADLLFNHSEHRKLVLSMQKTLTRTADAKALVFFSPHRPWLFDKDMAFFDLAREMGFVVEKVLERKMDKAMMVEDRSVRRSVHDVGNEEVKKVVFGYQLGWEGLQ